MALQLPRNYKGTTLNYHMIADIHYNKFLDKTNITIASYVDENTRRGNIKDFLILSQMPGAIEGNKDISEAYEIVKTKDEFSQATDC